MTKSFAKIVIDEGIKIPTTIQVAKRVQRYSPLRSVSYILDEESLNLINREFPLKCKFTLIKKVCENLIILNRERYRRNDKTRLELMESPNYGGFKNESFYYKKE